MLRFFAVPLMLAGVLGAQDPAKLFEKAPPEVEAALRERLTGFFQAHVDGKFRQADQFVAEDTRDYYYEANKPRYLSFEILDITWSGNFTRAKVKVLVEQRVMIPGFADRPMKVPIGSDWKLEGGKWCWWVDQTAARMSPFGGSFKGGDANGKTSGETPNPNSGVDLAGVQKGIQVDRSNIEVSRDLKPQIVTVANGIPGSVSLSLDAPSLPGVEIRLDRTELGSGQKATLTVRANQKAAAGKRFEVAVLVAPLNLVLPVQVLLQ